MQALIDSRNPAIICLQESHLGPSHILLLRVYAVHRCVHPYGDRASGERAMLVKDGAFRLRVTFPSPFHSTLLNVCSPPATTVRGAGLANLLSQLKPPFNLPGEFNSTHII